MISTMLLFLTGFFIHSSLAIDISIFEKSEGGMSTFKGVVEGQQHWQS